MTPMSQSNGVRLHHDALAGPASALLFAGAMRSALLWTAVLTVGCMQPTSPPDPHDLCAVMAARCGGANADNWETWCHACVPESARMTPCDANQQCRLCAVDPTTLEQDLFGLPSDELEFLWTQMLPRDGVESDVPRHDGMPTGRAFVDTGPWSATTDGSHIGSWASLQPDDAELGDPDAFFCEPGPNLYRHDNVVGGGELVMRAVRLPDEDAAFACPSPFCRSGPYAACDVARPTQCPYGDDPETHGYGSASQLDRTDAPTSSEPATYGFGRYRARLRASGDAAGVVSGTVYAFFSQSSEPCVGGVANPQANTAEIDIELSSSIGNTSGDMPFCDRTQMCFIVSTWTTSYQGLVAGTPGSDERHQFTGFRYRNRETAGELRTYGYDWRPDSVRFYYDANPTDCDESRGGCDPALAAVGICEHTHFVPQRPSPLHFQLWNSWWGGVTDPGTLSEMTVTGVWHEPFSSNP